MGGAQLAFSLFLKGIDPRMPMPSRSPFVFGEGLGRHKRLLADTQQPREIVLMLHDQLSNLQQVVANGGTAREIDDALVSLITHSDPSIISPILSLLNESGGQDGMWSILHNAESFDVSPYIAGLLKTLPPLVVSCFWWAEVLIIRVLNSEPYVAELVTQLRDEPIRTKAVVATICEKLSEDSRFTAKAVSVLAAARV